MSTHNLLTIAGSDPSGGAGIQADLKTFAAHACYGASVITALTAQNTTGVKDVFPISPAFVAKQLRCVLEDVSIDAIKTGMLFDKGVIASVVDVLTEYQEGKGDVNKRLAPLIVDPVCASTSGHTLLQPDALDAVIKDLFPLATLITPNKTEAELLLRHCGLLGDGQSIESLDDMLDAALKLADLAPGGGYSVLLKGGHLTTSLPFIHSFLASHQDIHLVKQGLYNENMEILLVGLDSNDLHEALVVDLLYQPSEQIVMFARPRIDSTSTHGTGCTLAASIACGVARGISCTSFRLFLPWHGAQAYSS
jgi:hydroxymethylpyrimidine/phosphomethylpyrimidine kinase / thiaminase